MIAERSVVLGESSSAASSNDNQAHHKYRLHHAIGILACGANTNLQANSALIYQCLSSGSAMHALVHF